MAAFRNKTDRLLLGHVTCIAVILLLALTGSGEAKGRVAGETGRVSSSTGRSLYVINPGDSAVRVEPAGSLGMWARVFDGLCLIAACDSAR